MSITRVLICSTLALACPSPARADPLLADFDYPHPVQRYEFQSQGQSLSMAYMDVRPAQPNGKTVVLLHGKNFCGATWEETIGPLRDAGYRVVVPDQIGFCKSSKPQAYQFGLHQLAANTHALLASIGAERPIVVGHSMGGMLAMRYALMYPREMAGLVLVNPIGLEDWKAKGVPFATVDQLYERELKTSFDSIKKYQLTTYYAGEWKPAIRSLGEYACGHVRGRGRQAGRLEPGAHLRHGPEPARHSRDRPDYGADGADYRPEGYDRYRQGPRAARTCQGARELSRSRAQGARAHQGIGACALSRSRPLATGPGPADLQQGPH